MPPILELLESVHTLPRLCALLSRVLAAPVGPMALETTAALNDWCANNNTIPAREDRQTNQNPRRAGRRRRWARARSPGRRGRRRASWPARAA